VSYALCSARISRAAELSKLAGPVLIVDGVPAGEQLRLEST
jgi:hypothetical protein